jgi:uncharacterized repeat protein (TIGR03803 family)
MCFRIFTLKNAVVMMLITLALSLLSSAQTESTIFTFGESTDFWPQGALLEDSSGNLYGTAKGGGAYGVGAVYELSPPAVAGGAWTQTYLYSFVPYGGGGYVPFSDLVRDQAGAFYGTFFSGGDPTCNCGGVYKLTPPATQGGAWTESAIYTFKSTDGHLPSNGALALTRTGTLYGTTVAGGTYNSGVLYQLTTKNGITYSESVLYSFGNTGDADTPNGPILLDSSGNLYGVTSLGGAFGQGALYKYVPAANGNPATESLLFSFGGSSTTGSTPSGSLIFDSYGNIYGVTTYGGSNDDGVVYELSPSNPTWTQTILYTFSTDSGVNPLAGLSWNHTNNNLYGTTSNMNMHPAGAGTVFKLVPPATKGGTWTETTLEQFTYRINGGYPTGVVTRDPTTGTLYGTAQQGGVEGCDLYCGVVWQITNP